MGRSSGNPPSSAPVDADPFDDPNERMPHVRALDGLRGVAVLTVVAFHFSPETVPGGFLGVDVFFVLSGFLITSLLVREHAHSGGIGLVRFWVRRARRLLPALLLLLVAVGVYGVVSAAPFEAARLRDDGLSALGYFANWHFIATGQSYVAEFVGLGPSPLRHTWSLAIEEQFYLVWPLVVAGLGLVCVRRGLDLRRTLIAVCVVLAAGSVVLMAAVHGAGDDPSRVYYGTDTRAHLLLLGGAFGALTGGVIRVPASRGCPLQVGGLLAAVGLVVLVFTVSATSSWLYEGGYLLVAAVVLAIIAAGAQSDGHGIGRVLGFRPLVGLGIISYGVYLWHWPVFLWVDSDAAGLEGRALFALRSAITLAVALVSYRLVERPIRDGALRRAGAWVPRVVAPVAVALAALMLFVPVVVAREPSRPSVREGESPTKSLGITQQYALVPTCTADVESDPRQRGRAEVLLIGNSVAAEIDDCLGEILAGEGYRLRSDAHAGEALCDAIPRLTAAVRAGDHPPIVAIYALKTGFSICWTRRGTAEPAVTDSWMQDVSELVNLYLSVGSQVFLVTPALDAGEAGDDVLESRFRELAAELADRVEVLDIHQFVRDRSGTYVMWMPCVAGGEPGCRGGLVQVRLALDGGSHFCTAADRGDTSDGPCPPADAAGVRRVAAGFAAALVPALRAAGG